MDALYTLDDEVLVSENRLLRPVVVPDQLQVYFVCGTQDTELNKTVARNRRRCLSWWYNLLSV